jgi:hypothetical protein
MTAHSDFEHRMPIGELVKQNPIGDLWSVTRPGEDRVDSQVADLDVEQISDRLLIVTSRNAVPKSTRPSPLPATVDQPPSPSRKPSTVSREPHAAGADGLPP